jgi:hypothetical protein
MKDYLCCKCGGYNGDYFADEDGVGECKPCGGGISSIGRSRITSALCSFLWPGAGHLYIGALNPRESDRGIYFALTQCVIFFLSLLVTSDYQGNPSWHAVLPPLPLYILAATDAVLIQNKLNRKYPLAKDESERFMI